jgi:hypothetical protein
MMRASEPTAAPAVAAAVPCGLPAEPYRGIEPFRYLDAPIFSGRNEDTEKLLRSITIYRGVLLFGDSGVGKSSLINAGLIPRAMEKGFRPERIRVQPRPGQEIVIERLALDNDGQAPYLPSLFSEDSGGAPRWVISARQLLVRLHQESKTSGARRLLILPI